MADVFISYAREDKNKAMLLARAFEQRGWRAWWDHTIPPGKTFEAQIQEALSSAKCVVVLWSHKSVISDWVKDEAAEGKRRRRLVPARLDDTTIPLGFRQLQVADLSDWPGREPHSEFEKLIASVATYLDHSESVQPKPRHDRWSAKLVSKGRQFKTFTVHLAHEEHTIECRILLKWKVPIVVKVDGETVVSIFKEGSDSSVKKLNFSLTDGPVTHNATAEIHVGFFDQMKRCSLRISNTELISV